MKNNRINSDQQDNNSETNIDMSSEMILLNLKIISQIKENEKLNINIDQLSIDNSKCQFFTRAYYGNSRENTTIMIENIINNALSSTDKILLDAVSNDDVKDDKRDEILREDPSQLLHRYLLVMSNSIKGLENLKVTYKDDVSVKSKLDLIIEKIKTRIEKINKVLTINFKN